MSKKFSIDTKEWENQNSKKVDSIADVIFF
jgi:hypothetical protein